MPPKVGGGLPPPIGRRVYAHIDGGSFACPRCGTIHTTRTRRRAIGRKHTATLGRQVRGYDPWTARFSCTSCGYAAYLGVVFWPVGRGGVGLPKDHVLTPGEAAELRMERSFEREAPGFAEPRAHVGRIRRTNVECTCGEPCPVHGEGS